MENDNTIGRAPDRQLPSAVRRLSIVQPSFDHVVHGPPRLQVCGLLAERGTVDFATLRQLIGVSDSVLSKHVKQLETAGYVRVSKSTVDSRQRTALSMTAVGRVAFAGHVAELRRIAGI